MRAVLLAASALASFTPPVLRALPSTMKISSPELLEDWQRLPDGRLRGTLDGKEVWLTPTDGDDKYMDAQDGVRSVQCLGGRTVALGVQAAANAEEATTARKDYARTVLDESLQRAAASFVLLCATVGFFSFGGMMSEGASAPSTVTTPTSVPPPISTTPPWPGSVTAVALAQAPEQYHS